MTPSSGSGTFPGQVLSQPTCTKATLPRTYRGELGHLVGARCTTALSCVAGGEIAKSDVVSYLKTEEKHENILEKLQTINSLFLLVT